ncbi:hypothetical protein KGQ71_00915, partial [Patescibacteria group bacterium]|nr:hypothetical protein [Patescibacteria group bacterium]
AIGATWQNNDQSVTFNGAYYEPKDIEEYDPAISARANEEIAQCLAGILQCEISGKPFRILPRELEYYIRHKIQIPRRHADQRHLDRLAKLNQMRLYHRQCMCEESEHGHPGRCKNEFETTYSPERPEKVYCEGCYQKEMI